MFIGVHFDGGMINRRVVYTLSPSYPLGLFLELCMDWHMEGGGGVYLRTCITIITMKLFNITWIYDFQEESIAQRLL
jgi:hypothetical protein